MAGFRYEVRTARKHLDQAFALAYAMALCRAHWRTGRRAYVLDKLSGRIVYGK